MPEPAQLQKAELQAISWDESQQVSDLEAPFPVQFNPETLKVAFANKNSGGDQRGGAATQFVAQGTTKLSFDLWFDVSAPQPAGASETDVRRLTEKVNALMRPRDDQDGAPPGVRFLWGTFLFEGVMDSMNETLELFSADGRPLRATVAVALSKQEIQFQFGNQQPSGVGSTPGPGTAPLAQAQEGDSVQSMAAAQGQQDDWQSSALENGVENPRDLPAGTPLAL